MNRKLLIVFLMLINCICFGQNKEERLKRVVTEITSHFSSLRENSIEENSPLNYKIDLIEKIDNQIYLDNWKVEYGSVSDDSITLVFRVADSELFSDYLLPNCQFIVNQSIVLLYDSTSPIYSTKKNKKELKKISKLFKTYSNVYLTWIVQINNGTIRIEEVFGYRSNLDSE